MLQIVNQIHIRCDQCGEIFTIDPDSFDFQVSSEERQMGPEISYFYEDQIPCPKCDNLINLEITGFEYPAGAFNFSDIHCNGGKNTDEPTWEIIDYFEAPDDDEYERCKEKIVNMSPREFELFTGRVIERMGFQVTVTQATRDGGFDVIAESNSPIPITLIAECKHYKNPVGVSVIRSAYGVLEDRQANVVAVVTSSRFSEPAIEFAERHGKRINLIDLDSLASQLYQMKLEV